MTGNQLYLIPQFRSLRPGQVGNLALINQGPDTLTVTLSAEAPPEAIRLSFSEQVVTLATGQRVEVKIQLSRTGAFVHPVGKTFAVPVRALSNDGTQRVQDITVELPPRYEMLSPLALLLCAATTFFVLPLLLPAAAASTATPSLILTETATPSATRTVTPTLTLTHTPTPTSTPTQTVTPAPCTTLECSCAAKGGFIHVVRPGDTWGHIFLSPNPNGDSRISQSADASGVEINDPLYIGQELCLIGIRPDDVGQPGPDEVITPSNSTISASVTVEGGITPVCGQSFNVVVTLTNNGRSTLPAGTLFFRDLHPASGNERGNASQPFNALEPRQSQSLPFSGVMIDIYYNDGHSLQAIVDGQVIGQYDYSLGQGNCNLAQTPPPPQIPPPPVNVPVNVAFSFSGPACDSIPNQRIFGMSFTNATTGATQYQWRVEYFPVAVIVASGQAFRAGNTPVHTEIFSTEQNPVLVVENQGYAGYSIDVTLIASNGSNSDQSSVRNITGVWNDCAVAY